MSDQVERWGPKDDGGDHGIYPNTDGAYVHYSDYEKLAIEAKFHRDERIEAEGRELKAKAKARQQRDEEWRERLRALRSELEEELLLRGHGLVIFGSIFEEAD